MFKQYYHIGIAVDTEQGLIVPVIRDVDKKSHAAALARSAAAGRQGAAAEGALEEMQGGTFTISNQGGIGGGHFTPIINVPEVAILGMGRSVVRPVVREGKIGERTMLPLWLSYDHRMIDGANAARFMVDLVRHSKQFDEEDREDLTRTNGEHRYRQISW